MNGNIKHCCIIAEQHLIVGVNREEFSSQHALLSKKAMVFYGTVWYIIYIQRDRSIISPEQSTVYVE